MSESDSSAQPGELKRGRICPKCGTHVDESDMFCPEGDFSFKDTDPVVDFDDVKPGAPATPVFVPPPAAPEVPVAALVPSGAPSAPSSGPAVLNKKCWVEVIVDLVSPREGRPDDSVRPTVTDTASFVLTQREVTFGRMVGNHILVDDPNEVFGRHHGSFMVKTDGTGYYVQCKSQNGIFLDGEDAIFANEAHELKDGARMEVGDWWVLVYHEESI